jgi:O-acetyl-ADP-ribose deacetylase (regulator of RNase III)
VFNTETARSQVARVLPSGDQPRLEFMLGARRVEVRLGRIERASADVIVNASNTQLRLGSGVSGAIKKEASNPAALQAAMYAHAPIGEGQLVVTDSWLPNTPRIFHVATASGGAQAVRAALRAVLEGCARHGVDHLATPALGTGTGGLSMSTFGQLAREVVEAHQAERPTHLTFVLYSAGEFADFTAGFGPPTA